MVAEAKKQLKSLAKEAQELGKVFDRLGVTNGLGNIATGLEGTRQNLKKVTDDIVKQYSDSARKIRYAQTKVVEAISHNYSFGHISPEQAHQQLKEYILKQRQQLGYQNYLSKKRNNGATLDKTDPEAFARFNSEIVKAEALMKGSGITGKQPSEQCKNLPNRS